VGREHDRVPVAAGDAYPFEPGGEVVVEISQLREIGRQRGFERLHGILNSPARDCGGAPPRAT
jgi:hypothetical protein